MAAVEQIRNVAFCGHGSSGKTTLTDQLLVLTGAVSGNPSVDDGASTCDFDAEEQTHKYSIEAAVVNFEHKKLQFNVIDAPGYPDFIGQTIGAFAGVDTAAVVINAHAGIEVNTRRVFAEAEKAGLGRVIVINKMDDENVDFEGILGAIQDMWGARCVPLNVPIGAGADFKGVVSTLRVPDDTSGALVDPTVISEPLLESIIEVDEAVMERYFEGEMPSDDEIASLAVRAVAAGSLVPIFCCSAKTGVGLPELLDGLGAVALPPNAIQRSTQQEGEEIAIGCDENGPLVGRVFKTRIDPFVQKLSYIRIFSGKIARDQVIPTSESRKGIKLAPILKVQGAETTAIDSGGPGDIVAIAKMDDLHTGVTLGETELPPISFPTPMVGLAVAPKNHSDDAKLSGALHKIVEEDSTFRLDRDAQTKELVMTGMSELHLKIIQERLARRDKLEVTTKEPKIPFRETIQQASEGSYRHKKQSGGRGQFGEVHIKMYPLPHDVSIEDFVTKDRFPSCKETHYDEQNNFLWVDSIVGGSIPGNFMPAIAKGFRERMSRGVIAGYQVQDVCVDVHFGKYHDVDSSEAAFKTAASMAFRDVFLQSRPALLEPVVKMDITVPEGNVGDVYSDLSSRGGRVQGSDAAGGAFQTVHCEVPLREVTTYSRTLSSMTGGQGSYHMEFSHYEVMPANEQQNIMAKAQMQEDEDE